MKIRNEDENLSVETASDKTIGQPAIIEKLLISLEPAQVQVSEEKKEKKEEDEEVATPDTIGDAEK